MVLQDLLNPVFSPLLQLESWLAILIISAIITVITTLAYKYLTDQDKMKKLKAEMKEYQKKLKILTKEDPKKAMVLQKEMMGKNMDLMKHSFKPTMYTLIPIIIIFGWLNAHMAYDPLLPGEQFDITLQMVKETTGEITLSTIPDLQVSKDTLATQTLQDGAATWTMKGDLGEYQLTFTYGENSLDKNILITEEIGMYSAPEQKLKEKPFSFFTISNTKIKPLENSGLPLVNNFGWIGVYILFSFVMSFSLRKALKLA